MTPGPRPTATDATGPPSWMAPVTPVIPDHELVRRIGGGSYGDVWLARTAVGTWRAVKVVFRDRFTDVRPYEREFNGMLKFEPLSRSNEAFVDILQVGRNDADGYFYYVMELADDAAEWSVGGLECRSDGEEPAAQYSTSPALQDPSSYVPKTLSKVLLQRGRLPAAECVELGLTLNLGLAHLHRAGLIHRDIKPSNIIFVGGVPKLADIGLVIETAEARSYVGTEGFIPPEGPTSPQADLFSLGKVLYEASMGKDRKDFPEPLTQIAELADNEQLLEFNAILLQACAANVTERYPSAEAMNADLALLQSGGSVRRQRKLAAQMRLAQRAGATVTVLAALIATGWLWQLRQTRAVREIAAEKTRLAEANQRLISTQEEQLIRARSASGVQKLEADDVAASLPWFVEALGRAEARDPRQAELHRLRLGNLLRYHPRLLSVTAQTGDVHTLAFSPDGRWFAAGSDDGQVQIIDVRSSSIHRSLIHTSAVHSVEFSQDSQRLLTACEDGVARLWSIESTKEPVLFPHQDAVRHATFGPDGEFVLTASADKTARIWKAADGQPVGQPLMHTLPLFHACFSPDGRRIATGSGKRYESGEFNLWDRATASRIGAPVALKAPATWTAFSPDGTRVASSCGEAYFDFGASRPGVLVDATTGLVIRKLEHLDRITQVDFSPDGQQLAIATLNYDVLVCDARTGEPLIPPLKHSRWVQRAVFSPDGRWIASASSDGTARVWDAATGVPVTPPLKHSGEVFCVAFDPDGRRLATAGDGGLIYLWDIGHCRPALPSFWYTPGGLDAQFSPDERLAVTAAERRIGPLAEHEPTRGEEPISVWDTQTGRLIWKFPMPGGIANVLPAISPASDQIAAGAKDEHVFLWDLRTGKLRWPPFVLKGGHNMAHTFSHDGKNFATRSPRALGEPSNVRIWTASNGQPVTTNLNHPDLVRGVVFSPDDRRIATACCDGKVRVWDAATGQLIRTLAVCQGEVDEVRYSRDGRHLLTADKYDKTARLWDAETGQLVFPPLRHAGIVWEAKFDPSESRILTTSSDMSAVQWDARTGERLDPPLLHSRGINGASYDGTGRLIATSSLDQTVRLWSAETGELLAAPFRHANSTSSCDLTKNGSRLITSSSEGRAQIWDLVTTDWPVDDLKRYAEALSAQSLKPDGQIKALSAAEIATRLAELRAARPPDFKVSSDQLERWHQRERIDSKRAGNNFSARFHARHTTLPDFD